MTADATPFKISANASESQVARAYVRLVDAAGVVLFDERVALRVTPSALLCDVFDPEPSSRRCEHEYAVLLENARLAFVTSKLGGRLRQVSQQWRVVDVSRDVPVVLWRAPV